VPLIQPEARLVVVVPAGDVTDAWAQLLPGQAIAGGAALAFAALFGIVLAERITRPVRQMTRASRAIARGNYDQRIDAHGSDEIGQLARAFNEMASEVGRSQRAMRQLLGNVSHDLRTPLTSIQGFSQAIVDGMAADAEETKQLASVIHGEAEHMGALVDDLLYLSRIESGELILQPEQVDLDGLLTAATRRLRFQAESNEVTVRLAIAAGSIQADGRRLEQVFANLLDNAIRFAPAGSEVLVRSYRAGDRVGVEVHNGGEPIAEHDLPHVFDRFYQGDPARKRGHAGLGLAIVHELVHAHGGEVGVQSAVDSGTTFTVWLPRGGPDPENAVVGPVRSRVPRPGRIASRMLHRDGGAKDAPLAPGESEGAGT
jgi:two-component system sensor histidine kinase BaeS